MSVTDAEDGTTTYEYDAYGNRTAVVDPLGRRAEMVYDDSNRVVDVIRGAHDPSVAITTHYAYDVYGRVFDVTTAYGTEDASTTHTGYDAVGRREYVTTAYGTAAASTTFYEYDDAGRLTDVTTAYGTEDASTTHTGYDAVGRREYVTTAYGTTAASTTFYQYDDAGRLTDVTTAYGTAAASTTHTDYDDAGRQTDVTTAYGTVDASTTHYEYDDAGQLKHVTGAYGTTYAATTSYQYDERGRLDIVTYPDGSTTSQTYLTLPTGDGSVRSTRDAAGIVTDSVYDLAGRLDRVVVTGLGTPAPQQITRYEYDEANRQTAVDDPLGDRTTFTYDDAGRVLTTTGWLDASTGYTTSTAYNAAGQVETTTDANDRVTTYHYDPLGRLLSTDYPGGVSTSQTYDDAGRRETATDENGTVTRYGYDPAGRLASVTLADGTADAATTVYEYNAAGQLLTITDALDRVTGFKYDDAGRQETKTWPDGSTEHFGYSPLGDQTSHTLADGNINHYDYDPMGRLLEATYFDGQSASFTYEDDGQRETASTQSDPPAAAQTTTYEYDEFRRPEWVTAPDGRRVFYDYDDANRRTQMATWLDATTQAASTIYDYDGLGRLKTIDDGNGVTVFTYDPVGVVIERSLPNGVTTTYDYNDRYQLESITHSDAGGVLQSFTYELDDAGMRWGVTEEDGSSTAWDYDDAYRLTAEQRFDPADTLLAEVTYTYDDAGNRLTETVGGATTYFEYNNLDQLRGACDTEWDGTTCTTYDAAYSYDDRGNLAQVLDGVETTTFTFDAADRLAGVDMPGGAEVAFTYDADGQRITQTADGQTTEYLWDEYSAYGDVVLETGAAGEVSYTLANGQLLSQTRNGVPNYYLNDGQGSVRALADATGNITDTYSYDAFGELYEQTGTTDNSYLYTGQQFDGLTGLYSLRARYYNPALGRFLSQDTMGVVFGNPVELNRYGYAANRPINLSDPSGLQAATAFESLLQGVSQIAVVALPIINEYVVPAIAIIALSLIVFAVAEPQMRHLIDIMNAPLGGNFDPPGDPDPDDNDPLIKKLAEWLAKYASSSIEMILETALVGAGGWAAILLATLQNEEESADKTQEAIKEDDTQQYVTYLHLTRAVDANKILANGLAPEKGRRSKKDLRFFAFTQERGPAPRPSNAQLDEMLQDIGVQLYTDHPGEIFEIVSIRIPRNTVSTLEARGLIIYGPFYPASAPGYTESIFAIASFVEVNQYRHLWSSAPAPRYSSGQHYD